MKVLMINVVCGIRSTGRICTDLAKSLEKQGHEVKIAYGREKVPEEFQKYAIRIGSDLDIKSHVIKARLLDSSGFGSRAATIEFIKWVNEYNPDIIHLHNIHGYYINVEVLFDYLKTCRKKIIWTLHDSWSFTGHSPYCDTKKCFYWIDGCHDCPLIGEYPSSIVDKSEQNWKRKSQTFTGVNNLTIVTPSKWLEKRVEKSFLKEYPTKVINNGIDTTRFQHINSDFKQKNNLEDKFLLLGVASYWDEMKGYSDYVKLANILDDNYKIILVGLTKNQSKKLPKRILGIEKTNSVHELASIYSAADLFLNLSYCENYPTVNLESIACGTPVLTYKTGGSPEIVEKYGGYIVEQGNVDDVAMTIQYLKKEGFKQDRINRDIIDNKQVIENYLQLYVEKE